MVFDTKISRRSWEIVVSLVIFLALPNALFFAAGQLWFVDRAWINLDYLLLGALCAWLGATGTAVIYLGILVLDVVFAFAPAYHFSLTGVVASVHELFGLRPTFALLNVLVVALIGGSAAWLVRRSVMKLPGSPFVTGLHLGLVLLIAITDARLSGVALRSVEGAGTIGNIASSTANSARIAIATALQGANARAAEAAESATDALRQEPAAGNRPAGRVFLVVVESMGVWRDRELDALQLGPILELGKESGWSVRTGSVPFAGSTVPAELRELCAIRLLTVQPSPREIPSERCLPAKMKRLGYETLAAHGFLGTTFGRVSWYPSLGFDRIWFAPEVHRRAMSPRRCGIAFNGLCDDVVWEVLVSHVVSRPEAKHFVYWLTLSAHLPVEYRRDQDPSNLCDAHAPTRDNASLCRLLLWHRALLADIADTLRTQLSEDVHVIVVGDHAPPFLERGSRELFEESRVPFVEIRSVAD